MRASKTEDGLYLNNENDSKVGKLVKEPLEATLFSYWGAINTSNLFYQV